MVRYRTTRWDSDPWQAFSARSGRHHRHRGGSGLRRSDRSEGVRMSGVIPIGHVHSGYTDPELLPPQSLHNVGATGSVVVRDHLIDALLGLDRYEYLWLLTWLHAEPIQCADFLVCRSRPERGDVRFAVAALGRRGAGQGNACRRGRERGRCPSKITVQ